MKVKFTHTFTALAWLAFSTLYLQLSSALAEGTAFTYQGRLNSGGNPANGWYDFRFKLYTDLNGNYQVGSSYLTNAVPATNGLFVTTIDFGPGIFTGTTNWLEVGVRTNGGGSYTVLNPLQNLTPTPNAIFAGTAGNLSGVLPAAQLGGTILNSSLPASPVFSGTVTAASGFSGNGAGVTNVNAAALGGLASSNYWQSGGNNVAAGQFLGSTNNQALELHAGGQRALLMTPGATDAPNLVGGAPVNVVDPGVQGAVITGGGTTNFLGLPSPNRISSDFSSVGGGSGNWIQSGADHSSIGGGWKNAIQANAYESAIGGGQGNLIQSNAQWTFIGGGSGNVIQPDYYTSQYATIAGGLGNTNVAYAGFIGGGVQNLIQSNAFGVTIGGGVENVIQSDNSLGYYSAATIAGGELNTNGGSFAFVGGGLENIVTSQGDYSAIGGGELNHSDANQAFIGSGYNNVIQSNAQNSAIVNGYQNTIQTNAHNSFIGGGQYNLIEGFPYFNYAGFHSTIVGGFHNTINGSAMTFIGGGQDNFIQSNSPYASISGGQNNTNTASAGTIAGGQNNSVSGGYQPAVGGGYGNQATNGYATVPGGILNVAGGLYSFAAGQQAQATNQGAFVWADSQNAPFASLNNDTFNVRAQGGVWFVTGGAGLNVDGLPLGGVGNVNLGTGSSINGGSYNTIGSGIANGTISGGLSNYVNGVSCTVSGGENNQALAFRDTVGGGVFNQASGGISTVAGGWTNVASGNAATIGGGDHNLAGALGAVISGGEGNLATNAFAAVLGGANNVAGGSYSLAAGQQARALHQGTFVWADSQNTAFTSTANNQFNIRAGGGVRLVTGGAGLNLDGLNVLTTGSANLPFLNATQNFTGRNSFTQGIGVGTSSSLEGDFNINTNTYLFSHTLYLRGETGTDHNHGLAYCGTGETNFSSSVLPDGPVLWGFGGGALGAMNGGAHALLNWNSTSVNVGFTNDTQTSPPVFSTVGNRSQGFPLAYVHNIYPQNLIQAGPALRVVNEGNSPDGALSVSVNVPSTASGSYIAEFGNTASYVVQIGVDGTVYSKGSALTSDRNAKENFTALDGRAVLAKVAAMPVTEWNYKDDSADKRHVGPMAQDFQAAFGLNGADDKHISVVDEGGVALAAIQGLNQKLTEELKLRDAENADLKARLEKLEQLISQQVGGAK